MSERFPSNLSPPVRFAPLHRRTNSRSPSRSPTRQRFVAHELDPLLSNLSPKSTLEALQATEVVTSEEKGVQDVLRKSISQASTTDRALGIRAALAAQKLREWHAELAAWDWPKPGSQDRGNGFQPPAGGLDGKTQEAKRYHGSLPAATLEHYTERIDEIRDGLEALDVEELKEYVLNAHVPGRSSRPGSRDGPAIPTTKSLSYVQLKDFTAVITATILQALPFLTRLSILLTTWDVRLTISRRIPDLLDGLGTVRLNLTQAVEKIKPTASNRRRSLTRDQYDAIRAALEDQVSQIGSQMDFLLDTLEGREDTLPDDWIDELDSIETDFSNWTVEAENAVLETQWLAQREKEDQARKAAEEAAKAEREAAKINDSTTEADSEQASQEASLPEIESTEQSARKIAMPLEPDPEFRPSADAAAPNLGKETLTPPDAEEEAMHVMSQPGGVSNVVNGGSSQSSPADPFDNSIGVVDREPVNGSGAAEVTSGKHEESSSYQGEAQGEVAPNDAGLEANSIPSGDLLGAVGERNGDNDSKQHTGDQGSADRAGLPLAEFSGDTFDKLAPLEEKAVLPQEPLYLDRPALLPSDASEEGHLHSENKSEMAASEISESISPQNEPTAGPGRELPMLPTVVRPLVSDAETSFWGDNANEIHEPAQHDGAGLHAEVIGLAVTKDPSVSNDGSSDYSAERETDHETDHEPEDAWMKDIDYNDGVFHPSLATPSGPERPTTPPRFPEHEDPDSWPSQHLFNPTRDGNNILQPDSDFYQTSQNELTAAISASTTRVVGTEQSHAETSDNLAIPSMSSTRRNPRNLRLGPLPKYEEKTSLRTPDSSYSGYFSDLSTPEIQDAAATIMGPASPKVVDSPTSKRQRRSNEPPSPVTPSRNTSQRTVRPGDTDLQAGITGLSHLSHFRSPSLESESSVSEYEDMAQSSMSSRSRVFEVKRASIASIEHFTPRDVRSVQIRQSGSFDAVFAIPRLQDGATDSARSPEDRSPTSSTRQIERDYAFRKLDSPGEIEGESDTQQSLNSSPVAESPALPRRSSKRVSKLPTFSPLPSPANKPRPTWSPSSSIPLPVKTPGRLQTGVPPKPTSSPKTVTPRRPPSPPPMTTDEHLEQKISSILHTIPARIRLTSGPPTSTRKTSNHLDISKATNHDSSSSSGVTSRSSTPTPSLTLSPASAPQEHASQPRSQGSADSSIRLYNLHQAGRDQPIKLHVRLVGEKGERVMVRTGGGWADLGEWLRDYAQHHGSRAADGRFQVESLPTPASQTSNASGRMPSQGSGRTTPGVEIEPAALKTRRLSAEPYPVGVTPSSPTSAGWPPPVPSIPHSMASPATFISTPSSDAKSSPKPTPPLNNPGLNVKKARNFSQPLTSLSKTNTPVASPTNISHPTSTPTTTANTPNQPSSTPSTTTPLAPGGPKSRSGSISAEKQAWIDNMMGAARRVGSGPVQSGKVNVQKDEESPSGARRKSVSGLGKDIKPDSGGRRPSSGLGFGDLGSAGGTRRLWLRGIGKGKSGKE